jgi:hypothetical protein
MYFKYIGGAKKEENDRGQVYKEISEKVRVPSGAQLNLSHAVNT